MTKKQIYLNNKLIGTDTTVHLSSDSEEAITIAGELVSYNYELTRFVVNNPISELEGSTAIKIELLIDGVKEIIFLGFIENFLPGNVILNKREGLDTVYRYNIAVLPKNIITNIANPAITENLQPLQEYDTRGLVAARERLSKVNDVLAKYGVIFVGNESNVRAQMKLGGFTITDEQYRKWWKGEEGILNIYRKKEREVMPRDIFYGSYDVTAENRRVYIIEITIVGLIVVGDVITFNIREGTVKKQLKLRIISVELQLSNFAESKYKLKGVQPV